MYTLLLALAGEGIHTGTSTAQSVGVSGSGQVTSQEVCHPVSMHFCTDTKLHTVLFVCPFLVQSVVDFPQVPSHLPTQSRSTSDSLQLEVL